MWVDVLATLGLDATLDVGGVYIYYVCTRHRILQETLGGKDDGYALLRGLLEDVRRRPFCVNVRVIWVLVLKEILCGCTYREMKVWYVRTIWDRIFWCVDALFGFGCHRRCWVDVC